jgi:hypothetical protein
MWDATKALGRKSTELGREANTANKDSAKTLDSLSPQSGKLKSYSDYVERSADSGLGRTLDQMGTKVVKEGTKSINDTSNPDGDS